MRVMFGAFLGGVTLFLHVVGVFRGDAFACREEIPLIN